MIEAATGTDAIFMDTAFDVEALVDFMQRRARHYGALYLPDQPAPHSVAPPRAVAFDVSYVTLEGSSLFEMFDLFSQHLDALHANLAVLEEWMRGATEQIAQSGQHMAAWIGELSPMLGALTARIDNLSVQLASSERRTSHDLAAIRTYVIDTLNTRLSALEHRVSQELDEIRQAVQNDFTSLEGRPSDSARNTTVMRLSPLIADGQRSIDGGSVAPIRYELE